MARLLVAANPDDLTLAWDKSQRTGKVLIDHNRNAMGQTLSSVYSVRPLPGAPVSAPLRWEEVGRFRNGDIDITNLCERLSRYGDLFLPSRCLKNYRSISTNIILFYKLDVNVRIRMGDS